jgi:hypothetical protein
MLNTLGSESQKRFVLLSAKDWEDKKPKLNRFMRELVSDKRMSGAIKIIQSEMKLWDGTVTARAGLLDSGGTDQRFKKCKGPACWIK